MTGKKTGIREEQTELLASVPEPVALPLVTAEAESSESISSPEAPPSTPFPIVGIGASAGGLSAFEAFFSGMPTGVEPGMAFVVVQHLAPDHKSILTDLIQRFTRMEVLEVEDGMAVRPNVTYIIPPSRDIALLNGTLHLLEPTTPRGQRLPIDFFFRSLAQDQRERAIGVVLSGTGSDGTLGLRAIKGEGGMVMVQNPESTEYEGMPRSALATGLVDFELPPDKMPAQLMAYAKHAFNQSFRPIMVSEPRLENGLKKIFILLRAQTGHDFSQYKPSTLYRRIERRMAVHRIESIEGYVKHLQQTPKEVEALFRDLLIGVTHFFRDPEAFQAIEEQILLHLFEGKPVGASIRLWLPGCSTGEEAYSLAILLAECMDILNQNYAVQVFATDIDSQAIATARAGLFPANIAADITPERLARFFTFESDGSAYRVHKSIRDMVVFSEHDLIRDPPFSRLDLISCRNLLIYMGGDLQKKLIPLFHYALRPGGMLFLGTSETIGDFGDLFAVLDRKSKLYQRKDDIHGAQRAALGRFLPTLMTTEGVFPRPGRRIAYPVKLPLRELTEQALLRQVAPAAVLVNGQGDILYLHGRTGMYLEPTPGESGINNILKMAREGLRRELTTALRLATGAKETVRCQGLNVKTNGHYTLVNLSIQAVATGPAGTPEAPLYLVVLEEAPPFDPEHSRCADLQDITLEEGSDLQVCIRELQNELRIKEDHLQATTEELEASNEELKSSNEDLQSVNEELQSTNEELETSKEEMQSVNEELATVNAELQTKVVDLSQANNDMNNLLAGTGIGTVFVDHHLRILRFTPAASVIINLIQSDLGRPVGHLASNLMGYDRLVPDTQAVLDTLVPRDVNVQTRDGRWYTMRIQPYRTLDNVIEGAVITFADITTMKKAQDALANANELLQRLAVVVRDANDAITVQDLEGRILAWNPGAVRMYGWTEAEALNLNVRERIPLGLREDALAKVQRLSEAKVLEPYFTQRVTKEGVTIDVSIISTALVNEAGETYAIATTERLK